MGAEAIDVRSVLWERVGELADRAPQISDLRHHKLHLIAASRMRARGEDVPAELRQAECRAAAIALGAAPLLRRIRAATDAELIVMKGPEAATRWPEARLRPWKDLDLFVEDADTVQAALLAAGFTELGRLHRLPRHPSPAPPGVPRACPIAVEVHRRPKWPARHAPPFEELIEGAVPSTFPGARRLRAVGRPSRGAARRARVGARPARPHRLARRRRRDAVRRRRPGGRGGRTRLGRRRGSGLRPFVPSIGCC